MMELLQWLMIGTFFGGFFLVVMGFLVTFVFISVVGWAQEYKNKKLQTHLNTPGPNSLQ